MELRKGYKQTEVGVIPEDWEVDTIKNVSSITTGAKNTQDKIEDGLYPFFVRSQTIERINSYSFDGEAILTAGDGVGTGKVFHYINGKFDFHQRVYKISHFTDRVNGYFFYLYFANNFFDRIMQMTAKSSVDSVRMEMIADMEIPIPTLAEQTAIATALSDADALISSLEKLIEKKRAIKQGAMQDLLKPKEGWVVKKLGETVLFLDGKRKPIKDSERAKMQGIYPYYGASGIIDFVNEYIFDDQLILLGEDGDNILSRSTKLAFQISGKVWVNNHAHVLKPNSDINITFLTEYLESLDYEIYNSGSAQPKINQKVCSNIPITIPDKQEQTRIAAILSDMDSEIFTLEQNLSKYKMLKQGMMQELLTGKTRLV